MLLLGVAICFVFVFVFSLRFYFLSFFARAHGVTWQIVDYRRNKVVEKKASSSSARILSRQQKRTFVFLAPGLYDYYCSNPAPTLAPRTFVIDGGDLKLREKSSTCQPAISGRMLIHTHLIYVCIWLVVCGEELVFLLLYMAVINTACPCGDIFFLHREAVPWWWWK